MPKPKTTLAIRPRPRPSSTASLEAARVHGENTADAATQPITVLFCLFPDTYLPSGRAPGPGCHVLAPCGTGADHNAVSLRFLAEVLGTETAVLSRALAGPQQNSNTKNNNDDDDDDDDGAVVVQLQWRLSGHAWPVNTTRHRVDAGRDAADVTFAGTLGPETGMARHLTACRFPGQDMAWPGPPDAAAGGGVRTLARASSRRGAVSKARKR